MIILALSDGLGKSADLLKDATIKKAKKINFKYVLFPENGLHPQQQLSIFDNLIKEDINYIVATHSESLVRRALRRLNRGEIDLNDIEIKQYIYSRNKERLPFWRDLELNEDGEIINGFRGGFFEQGSNESLDLDEIDDLWE